MSDFKTLDILYDMSNNLSRMESEMVAVNSVLVQRVGGISIIGTDGRYKKVNDKYAETCGYVPSELIGRQWVDTVYPPDLPIANQCYQEMLMKGESSMTFRGIKKDGTVFIKDITLVTKHGVSMEIEGHFCFMNENKNVNN